MKKILFAIAMMASLFHGAASAQTVVQPVEISYGPELLDVYQHPTNPVAPIVLFVRGGGWIQGSKRVAKTIAPQFLDAGYTFVAIDYRHLPDVTLNQQIQDVSDALTWVSQVHSDVPSMSVIAHSAGAHLVSMAILQTGAPALLDGIVLLDGSGYNLTRLSQTNPGIVSRLGLSAVEKKTHSPFEHVGTLSAKHRFFLAAGDDPRDTNWQSAVFDFALIGAGHTSKYKLYCALDHVGFLNALRTPGSALLNEVLMFIEGRY